MNLGAPETWQLLWVGAAGMFLVAEMARRLRLWFLPFALGAGAAAVAASIGVAVPWEWVLFVAVSVVSLFLMRPLARRLSALTPLAKIGSSRWIGREAAVVVAIPAMGPGWVRLGREQWRAESGLGFSAGAIPVGSTVLVTGVSGTHLIVLPLASGPVELTQRYQPTSGLRPDPGAS